MSDSLFGSTPPSNGAGASLFSSSAVAVPATTAGSLFASASAPVASPSAPPVLTELQRAEQIALESARLKAEDERLLQARNAAAPAVAVSYGFCSLCGQGLNDTNVSVLSGERSGERFHVGCPARVAAAPPVPVAVPHIAAVNPVDSPPFDPIAAAAAAPLSPEAIAAITDPALKAKVEEHARAHAAAAAAAPATAAKEKTSGRCASGGQVVTLTAKQIQSRKYPCGTCGKEIRIKDDFFTADFTAMTIPSHNRDKKTEVAAAPAVSVPVAVAPAIPPTIPAIPAASSVAAPPPIPTTAPAIPTSTQPSVIQVAAPPVPVAVDRVAVARSIIEIASTENDPSRAVAFATLAIAHALIAIAERLP